ncbi:SKIP/SNW domain-containing protein [Calycina marina]|uniref:Pre-mRNA-processing protein 45 n=1 Tax=Calycina marina TaxID=1763456 RepID=A0A9P7Z6C3_9HELO|nr:SKIP/SNW domain-containing protein [Calycina marina]
MAALSLSQALPKPKYDGAEEERVAQSGPRIVSSIDSSMVLKKSGPPPYGQRIGWRPRDQSDFGDGGAFPECLVAQYPLDMGRKGGSSSTALAVTLDSQGKVEYSAIASRGQREGKHIQSQFKDLIPLRQRAETGDLDLSRPDEDTIAATTERTKAALDLLVSGASTAANPKNVKVQGQRVSQFVRYQPSSQMGNKQGSEKILRIVQRQQDPLEPPKFKHKKIPRGPPSPPAPVLRSPPRKLTAADQEAWKIPPAISNWKNPKGFTVALDKRLAADGRGLQDVTVSDKFAQMSEALFTADRHAREEVKQRNIMQQRLAEADKQKAEDRLRGLAAKAREEASNRGRRNSRTSRSRSGSYSDSRSGSDSEDEEVRERQKMREEKRREEERKLRQSRMGAERRVQAMAREQQRDISEKIALGIAKPTQSAETMFDSRLFNRTSGFDSGFNEDQAYDKPLFAAQDAISSIYRPRQMDDDDGDDGEAEMGKIQKSQRFGEALGKGTFKGTEDVEAREGPVQFEKDTGDAFANVDDFLKDLGEAPKKREFGLQGGDSPRKRARVDEDDD